MSKYVNDLRDIILLINSKKITDVKKAIKKLLDLYEIESAIEEINERSKKRDSYDQLSWNNIFKLVHSTVVSEVERQSSKGNAKGNNKVQPIIYETFSRAKNFLNPQDAINSVLEILNNKSFVDYYNNYLEILEKCILRERSQRIMIKASQWRELLEACVNILQNKLNTNYLKVLEITDLVIKHGSVLSSMLAEIQNMLPLLGNLLENHKSHDTQYVNILFKLSYTVFGQLAVDRRLTLCKFSETIPLSLINIENIQNEEKYKFYLLLVKIHHPFGVVSQDSGDEMYNSENWKNILKLLHKMIFKEVRLDILSKSFLELACEVLRQQEVNNLQVKQSELFEESFFMTQPKKKRKIESEEKTLIDFIDYKKPENSWPVIQIMSVFYKKYPSCLKVENYMNLLELITKLTNQTSKKDIIESIYKLCSVLVYYEEKEKYLFDVKIYWDKIWDSALRNLLMFQHEKIENLYELIQNLIIHKKISDSDALLKLYTNNTLHCSISSIQTLELYCQNWEIPSELCTEYYVNSISNSSRSIKHQLLCWILEIIKKKLTTNFPIGVTSRILIGLTLKHWFSPTDAYFKPALDKKSQSSLYDDFKTLSEEDIESYYLSQALNKDFFHHKNLKSSNIQSSLNTDIPYSSQNFEFLVNSLAKILDLDSEKEEKELGSFIKKITLIAKLLTDLCMMKMIPCDFENFCLVQKFSYCLTKAYNQILNMDSFKINSNTLDILKSLNQLYNTKYDLKINDIIISSTNLDIIKKIITFTKNKVHDEDDDSYKELVYKCKIHASNVLALYCCLSNGSEISELQIKIVKNLLNVEKYSLKDESDMKIIFMLLDSLSNISYDLLSKTFIVIVDEFLVRVFMYWHMDYKVSQCLLLLLPKFIRQALHINYNDSNLLKICHKFFYNVFKKKQFGQILQLSFVKCLKEIIKEKELCRDEDVVLNSEIILYFLNSIYYSVREESLNYVSDIYSKDNIDFHWKCNFMTELRDVAGEIFVIDNPNNDQIIQDEFRIRSVTVVKLYANIICSHSFFESAALSTLLEIAFHKKIDKDILVKIFHIINNETQQAIIKENLNHILTEWISNQSLDNFPFALLDCKDKNDFYVNFKNIIVPVLIRNDRIVEAINICGSISCKFNEVFEGCFTRVLPWFLSGGSPQLFNQLKERSSYFSDIKDITSLTGKYLEEIILHIFKRFHDENHFYRTFNTKMVLPKSDPPYFDLSKVESCILPLERILREKDETFSFVQSIIDRYPVFSQKTLLNLCRCIYENRTLESKAKALHQYVYFCSLIVEKLKEEFSDSMSAYIIRDIVYTLLNLSEDSNILRNLCIEYLYTFFQNILPRRSCDVEKILHFCIKCLSPFINDVTSTEFKILQFLLIEHKNHFQNAIENLGTLSNSLNLLNNDLNTQDLNRNISNFLNTCDDKTCNLNNLINLKHQLINQKSELNILFEELETILEFKEQCKSSILHQLIYRLIKLTNSSDSMIALESVKCLGILGPKDLISMILHPKEDQRKETGCNVNLLTYKITELLLDLIVSNNIKLRSSASQALYDIFNFANSHKILEEDFLKKVNASNLFESYLRPFTFKRKLKISSVTIIPDELNNVLNPNNIHWSNLLNTPFDEWIRNLAAALLKSLSGFYFDSIISILSLDVNICKIVLPRILHVIIKKDSTYTSKVCECLNYFFEHYFLNLIDEVQVQCSLDIVQCMLDVVNYLRVQESSENALNFNYLPMARAAQFCSAYFSSILYAELWCRSSIKNPRYLDSIPIIEQIYDEDDDKGKLVQNILREAYLRIGDLDSIRGCGFSHLQDCRSRIQYYTSFHKWDKVILSHDVGMMTGDLNIRGMVKALQESSLHYQASLIANASSINDEVLEDLECESLWRLGNWNLIKKPDAKKNQKNNANSFSILHYNALKAIHENDNYSLKICVEKAYWQIINDLRAISLESCQAIYPKLSQLQILKEIEDWSKVDSDNYLSLIESWELDTSLSKMNFQYAEPIISQRAVLCQITDAIKTDKFLQKALTNIYLESTLISQQQGYLNESARTLETLARRQDLNEESKNKLLYNEAYLSWLRKDEEVARFYLRKLINTHSVSKGLLAQSLSLYGSWIADYKSENPQAIIKKYYEKSINMFISMGNLNSNDRKNLCKAWATLAEYCHEQYTVVCEYMHSPQFEKIKQCIDYQLDPARVKNSRLYKMHEDFKTSDSNHIQSITSNQNYYLVQAMKYVNSKIIDRLYR